MKGLDLLHWIGLVQTDGNTRKNKENKIRGIEFTNTNIKLVEKFCDVCKNLFGVYPKINIRESSVYKNGKIFYSGVYAINNKLGALVDVEFRDPPQPPLKLIKNNKKLFGAYLAGVIDGDGDIRIKRKSYPQCVVRITSGFPQLELKNIIENFLPCKVSITRRQRLKDGNPWKIWFALEFYVSSKNSKFIKNNILPNILSEHKSAKLGSYLSNK